jgi:hypothetical protein
MQPELHYPRRSRFAPIDVKEQILSDFNHISSICQEYTTRE